MGVCTCALGLCLVASGPLNPAHMKSQPNDAKDSLKTFTSELSESKIRKLKRPVALTPPQIQRQKAMQSFEWLASDVESVETRMAKTKIVY